MAKQKHFSTNPERIKTFADMVKAARRTDTTQTSAFNQTTKRPRIEEEKETTSKKERKDSEEEGYGESDASMKQIQQEANEISKQFRDEMQRAVEQRDEEKTTLWNMRRKKT